MQAFYLPGSVHSADTEMLEQGNRIAPHLYLFRKRLKHNKGMPSPRADCRVEELEVPTHLERRPLNASDSVRSQPPAGDIGLDSLFIPNRRNPKINKYQNPRTFAVPATNRHAPNNINISHRGSGPPGFSGRPLSQSHHPKVAPHSDPPPQPRGVHPSPLRSSSQNVAATSGHHPPRTSQSQHGVAPNAQFASSSRHHPSTPTSGWDSAVRAHTVYSSHNTTLPPCGDMYGNNNNRGVQHRLPPLPRGNPLVNPPLPPALPKSVLPERSSAATSLPSYLPPPILQGMQINRYPDRDPRRQVNPPLQFHQAPRQQSPPPPLPGEDYHEGGGWLED